VPVSSTMWQYIVTVHGGNTGWQYREAVQGGRTRWQYMVAVKADHHICEASTRQDKTQTPTCNAIHTCP
jgi:hypothetical protein